MVLETGIAATLLALVHLFSHRMKFLNVMPRSLWLSMAGGISVAYVFLHLLPELTERREILEEFFGNDSLVYLVAMIGLVTFYALERLAMRDRKEQEKKSVEADDEPSDKTDTSDNVFWIHMASFTVYNMIIGYLLLHEHDEISTLMIYTLAMGLHFVVNDFGLREHHQEDYLHLGRWILTGAILLGWAVGLFVEVNETLIAVLASFLAGAVVLNVLKEELPEHRDSRIEGFVIGIVIYSALLLVVS